jgi:ubiquinone/menaquinone biosynthesis C-methylase UbiE
MLFDQIAPFYSLFFRYQVRMYQRHLKKAKAMVPLEKWRTFLDVGSGTGALCYVLHKEGISVTGVELSPGMLKTAQRKLLGRGIDLIEADVLKGLPFEDKSFDVSIASFVAHGLNGFERKIMYYEMKRVARYSVILIDYNKKRSLITDIAERLEGGDYFSFIKQVTQELQDIFSNVSVVNTGSRSSWYVCKIE